MSFLGFLLTFDAFWLNLFPKVWKIFFYFFLKKVKLLPRNLIMENFRFLILFVWDFNFFPDFEKPTTSNEEYGDF